MTIACASVNLSTVFDVLLILVTFVGIIAAFYSARVTQKIKLSSRRVEIYELLKALITALERAYGKAQSSVPQYAADFADLWNVELDKEKVIADMYVKAGIENGSLYFIKDSIESDFSVTKYIFFAKQSSSCIDSIVKVMRKYANNLNRINVDDECDEDDAKAVCQLAATQFKIEDLEEIKNTIDKANSSMYSMEKEMTIRNCFNF